MLDREYQPLGWRRGVLALLGGAAVPLSLAVGMLAAIAALRGCR